MNIDFGSSTDNLGHKYYVDWVKIIHLTFVICPIRIKQNNNMKIIESLFFITITSLFLFSCKSNESDSVRDSARQSIEPQLNNNLASPGDLVPVGTVRHYICPNNCEGSGGSTVGNCPVCGTEYVHNAEYHAQGVSAPGSVQQPGAIQQPGSLSAPPPTPAQNAAGVYHYICNNGCKGGAGSAGPCAVCGAELVHNQAYHQ